MPLSFLQFLTEVDRMVELGAHEAAHEALDQLPLAHQRVAAVIRLRLIMMTEAGNWDAGLPLARLIRASHLPVIRRAAGKFYLAYAKTLRESGEKSAAALQLEKLQVVWPEGWCYVIAFLAEGSGNCSHARSMALPA
jgi:hypothetical protein